ncbi:hypothetical protein OG912_20450 [Streptomyces sp. NBC_00464]
MPRQTAKDPGLRTEATGGQPVADTALHASRFEANPTMPLGTGVG